MDRAAQRFVFLRFRSCDFVDRLSAVNQQTIHEVTRKGRNLHEQGQVMPEPLISPAGAWANWGKEIGATTLNRVVVCF
jgi:hypothetical protein